VAILISLCQPSKNEYKISKNLPAQQRYTGFGKLSIVVKVNNQGKVKLRGKYFIILPSM
jgi:hypothetical protein